MASHDLGGCCQNSDEFMKSVGTYALMADQLNLGVTAALRRDIYDGLSRATTLTTATAGGADADASVYVEFKVSGPPSSLANSYIGAIHAPPSWPTFPAEALREGDAPPDFLDIFRPQHHGSVFNAGTPRYFMLHLLNGRLFGVTMGGHCHFRECSCDACPGAHLGHPLHDSHDPIVKSGDRVGVYAKVVTLMAVSFFTNVFRSAPTGSCGSS